MHTIKSNTADVRLTIKTDTQIKTLDESKLNQIRPVELAKAFQLAARNTMYVTSINGKAVGMPAQTPITLASANIGDGQVAITREASGKYKLIIERVVGAECYHNSSFAPSYKPVYVSGAWQKVKR